MIHEKAHVTPDCVIGEGSVVWQFASIVRGARLGRDCSIADSVTIDGAAIGNEVRIQKGAFVSPGVKIGDNVFIGPGVVVCNDAWPRTHKDGYEPEIYDGTRWAVIVESGASIGAGAVILPGVRIGEDAMIAAGSVVTRDVPAGHLYRNGKVSTPIPDQQERMRIVT